MILSRRLSHSVLVWAIGLTALTCSAASQARERFAETIVMPLSGMGEPGEAPVYWQFQLDSGRGAGKWGKIRVPSCWEQEGYGAYLYGGQARHRPDTDPIIPKERGTYRSEFVVPAAWSGKEVRIVFDGVMTDTEVTVNGQSAGAIHQGGFYRFHYDITPLLALGDKNSLEVKVRKESSNASVNHAERRGDYWTFGGIYRPVWLEARPPENIERVAIDARADGSFYAQVYLNRPATAGRSLDAQVYDSTGTLVGAAFSVPVMAKTAMAVLRTRINHVQPWSAEHPHLYRVRFTLADESNSAERTAGDSAPLHEVSERFGFRTFEVRPRDGLYLNGSKIVLKGINRHSFRPRTGRTLTREESYADARTIKAANMNAVRMSHYPPDKHFLEAADEIGLYVLNELAGWQGYYDTPTGARLVGQVVRRDVNHPSVLFWDNGNEGGWNREVDGEFDRWDPQRRPVLHPWSIHSGINTDHYENFESTSKLSAGPDIFMPTEFLHGLYDGGIGAGLEDYWRVMSRSPTVAGGFFWVFADEGIMRTDRNGSIDNVGNLAPDGIVGPHGEKEGSYFAVKQIWSPIQIAGLHLNAEQSALHMSVRNHYAFTRSRDISFKWRALRFPSPAAAGGSSTTLASGDVQGPDIAPGTQMDWQLPLPRAAIREHDVLHLTAHDRTGHDLWTWSLPRTHHAAHPASATATMTKVGPASADRTIVRSAPYTLTFDTSNGLLLEIQKGDKIYPLSRGPRMLAYRRAGRRFEETTVMSQLQSLEVATSDDATTLATATYEGALRSVTWSRSAEEGLTVSYRYRHDALVDIMGIRFDLPESTIESKRWVGQGPYRVWQNRLAGGIFDLHEIAYNDPVPGETYAYPEFKGYFGEWDWVQLATSSGTITVDNLSNVPYFGLYGPKGGTNPVLELPDVGLSFLSVIPAIGTKFDEPQVLGQQSQPRQLSTEQTGSLRFIFH